MPAPAKNRIIVGTDKIYFDTLQINFLKKLKLDNDPNNFFPMVMIESEKTENSVTTKKYKIIVYPHWINFCNIYYSTIKLNKNGIKTIEDIVADLNGSISWDKDFFSFSVEYK